MENLPEYLDGLLEQIADPQVWPWIAGGAAALVVSVVVGFLLLRSRRRRPPPLPELVVVDLASVGDIGPPQDGPELRCYGIGVRLAVLILAPSGRQSDVPTGVERSALIDQIVPGLAKIVAAHRTLVLLWPPQLSPRGFANAFFTSVKLPGDRGKGTPWCSAAGKFEADNEQYMAGMALCAAKPNSLSQFVIELPGEWLELLRVYSEKQKS